MKSEPDPSPSLRTGLINLEGLPGAQILSDWEWHDSAQKWVLCCRLEADVASRGPVPAVTEWYVLVSSQYPHGEIKFHPSRVGGLEETFPHQNPDVPNGALPWRSGNLCLTSSVRSLGRHAYSEEPTDPALRLRWYFQRAQSWLVLASRRQLLGKGDPFELPAYFPTLPSSQVIFSEGAEGLATFTRRGARTGFAELALGLGSRLYLEQFRTRQGEVLTDYRWGTHLSKRKTDQRRAVWIRINGPPHIPEWCGPKTWGELRRAVRNQGENLDQLLEEVAHSLRDGSQHILLIGFPLPVRVGEPATQMHWLAIQLPILSRPNQVLPGFRKSRRSNWERDRRRILRDSTPVTWIETSNWHPDEISTRGRLPNTVRGLQVSLLGAGALGADVATLLIRGGLQRLGIIDPDTLEIGNLVRHPLGLDALGKSKSKELASQLNGASVHAQVTGIQAAFPDLAGADKELLEGSDLIVDCTASDTAIDALAAREFPTEKLFVSASFSYAAKRLYLFAAHGRSFPKATFYDALRPYLQLDREDSVEADIPWEGTGCWHPVFPAQTEDISAWASVTVRFIIQAVSTRAPAHFAAYELCQNPYFEGIRLLPSLTDEL